MEDRSPARVRNELRVGIVDELQGAATMRQPVKRDLWLEFVSQELDRPVEPFGGEGLRAWLLDLVSRCTQIGDGLSCLVRCIAYVEEQSSSVAALSRLVEEWEAMDFFNGADLRRLRPVLDSVGPTGLTALARRASQSRVQELPPWCDTAWQVFLRLAGANSAGDELPASMAFLVLVMKRLAEEGQAQAAEHLRRWNHQQAKELGLEEEIRRWHEGGYTQSASSPVPAYLMIQFEPDGIDPSWYYLSHWRQSDADGWHPVPGETIHLHRDELPAGVEQLVEQTEEKWADLRQPVILEFILPWELLNEPMEWWDKEAGSTTPLVMDYAVVLRSLERLRRTSWHRPWHGKWRQLKERPADSQPYWSRPDGRKEDPFHLERELKEDRQLVCLVLSEPPGGDSTTGRLEFLAGLRAGIPAMIWHRGDCAAPEFKDAAGEILQDRGLGSLAESVARFRREALALGPLEWDGHVGRHLAILLDDPERKPGPPGVSQPS